MTDLSVEKKLTEVGKTVYHVINIPDYYSDMDYF